MMYPKDAIRIARNHQIGMCYNQEDQLEHGGMIFKTGRKIGFYNPDHGPTVSAEEAKPPIPPELIPITECWLDPHFGLITSEVNERAATTESEQEEMDDEEADRRAAADRLLALMPGIRELSAVAAQEKLEDEEDMELKRLARLKKLANPLDALDEVSEEGKELKLPEPEAKQFDRRTLRLQEKLAKGYARDARKVVTYVIETMFDLQDEIATAEKEENSYKRRCNIPNFVNYSKFKLKFV